MGIAKDIFCEEYDKIIADLEEQGLPIDETYVGNLADNRMRDRFADMCDHAKDMAKERRGL